VFHVFGQAKFPNGCSVLGSSQFSILLQLPPKMLLDSKVGITDPKIIISLCYSKSVTYSVVLGSHFEYNVGTIYTIIVYINTNGNAMQFANIYFLLTLKSIVIYRKYLFAPKFAQN